MDKHLIKATLRALHSSPYAYAPGMIKILKDTPSDTFAMECLNSLFEFYIGLNNKQMATIVAIQKGYSLGAIPKKYR